MVVERIKDSKLRLVFEIGYHTETGEPIYKGKMFNKVRAGATAEQLYSVATALASLQKHPLYEVERRDEVEVRDE